MEVTSVRDLYCNPCAYEGKSVCVAGWVRTVRASNAFGFIELNDGSTVQTLQIVLEANALSNYGEAVKSNVGAAAVISGEFVQTPDSKQPFELHAAEFRLEGASAPEYPLQKKKHSLEYLRTIAHLRARTNTFNAVFRIRSEAAFAIHKFFNDRNFVYVHTPIITGSDCEGAGEMFRVTTLDPANPPRTENGGVDWSKDFFGKASSLTVSGQLEGETMAMAFGKIYTFGPTFRAENSNTQRHAAEFWMIEPEIAFADLNDDMALADEMIKGVVSRLLDKCGPELEFCNRFYDNGLLERLNRLVDTKSSHVTYTQAIEILKERKEDFEYPAFWGCDLQTEHERFLSEQYFKGPVFVTDYPKEIKAFYMRLNDDGRTVAAMDLLVPGIGEIIGGSQREERLNVLRERMRGLGLAENDYWWYLDLRRYGGTRHAGFGLGFERFIMYVTGIANIRDVVPYPRTVGNAEF